MTLQEFIRKHDSNGLVAGWLDRMKSDIYMMNCTLGAGSERYSHKADSRYYSLSGYIRAAYSFGLISFEESDALTDELIGMFR